MSKRYFELREKRMKLKAQRNHARDKGLVNEATAEID